jgi:hypothetical protein
MSDLQLQVASWNRFVIRGLGVKPELLGSIHEFLFQNLKVKIELPHKASFIEEEGDGARATIFSWREADGNRIPVEVAINSVDVIVYLQEDVAVPEKVLHVPLKAFDLFSESRQKHLDNLASQHGVLAEEAFDLWIRIVRWKTNSSGIGRPEIHGASSGWSTYLFDLATQKRFWAAPHILTIRGVASIDTTTWNEIQIALQARLKPPIFYDLMFDAIEQMEVGDLQRAVVSMAVACEAYMRNLLMQQLPQNLNDRLKRYIGEANIRRVLDNFLPELLNNNEKNLLTEIISDLVELFTSRNTILHSGKKEGLTHEECKTYLIATRKLIGIR